MRNLIVALILLLLCSPCFSKMRHLERKEEGRKRGPYFMEHTQPIEKNSKFTATNCQLTILRYED